MKEKTVQTPNSSMILLVLFLGWIVSYIDRIAMSLAVVQIGDEFSLQAAALGVVLSSFFMGYALMQIPGGWLADRFGSRKVVIVAVLVWSVFTALTGTAWSLASLLLIRFLFGLGEGGYPSASTKSISDYFPADKRTKAQSTMMSSNALGAALAPIICAPLLAWLGWRNVFFSISLLGIVIVALFLLYTRRSGSYANQTGDADANEANKGAYKQLLRNPFLWKVLLVFFFTNIANWGLSSWMPSYLIKIQGIDLKSAGLVTAIPALFSVIGMLISGRIIDKIGAYSKFGVIGGTFMLALFLFLITTASNITQVIVYQCIASTCASFVAAFVFTLPHRAMKQQVVGTAFGMINFGGQAAGILSPTIMGMFISASGGSYNSAFLFLTVSCLIASFIAVTLPGIKRHKEITDNTAANRVTIGH